MLVTRSSVASLQAKQGLPLGTQMVGWLTLGEFAGLSSTPDLFSCTLFRAVWLPG